MNTSMPSPPRVLRWLATLLLAATASGCGQPATPAASPGKLTIAAVTPPAGSPPRAPPDAHRKLPAGTLDYTIELTGKIDRRGPQPEERHTASIHRVAKVHSHMRGDIVNGDLARSNPEAHPATPSGTDAASPMADIQQAIETCGDDQACQQATVMALMSDPARQRAIQSVGEAQVAMIGRTDWWRQDAPCQGHITIDDHQQTTRWFEDAGEGYHMKKLLTRTSAQRADKPFDCASDPMMQAVGATLFLDTQTSDYDITILPITTTVDATDNDRTVTGRKAGTPRLVLNGPGGAREGQPIRGSKTLTLHSDDPVPVPLTAVVTWIFTPDPR